MNEVTIKVKVPSDFDVNQAVESAKDALRYSDNVTNETYKLLSDALSALELEHLRSEIKQLKHRIAMANDDLTQVYQFIVDKNLTKTFQEQGKNHAVGYSHLYNIEIACDLTDDECLCWKKYSN